MEAGCKDCYKNFEVHGNKVYCQQVGKFIKEREICVDQLGSHANSSHSEEIQKLKMQNAVRTRDEGRRGFLFVVIGSLIVDVLILYWIFG